MNETTSNLHSKYIVRTDVLHRHGGRFIKHSLQWHQHTTSVSHAFALRTTKPIIILFTTVLYYVFF